MVKTKLNKAIIIAKEHSYNAVRWIMRKLICFCLIALSCVYLVSCGEQLCARDVFVSFADGYGEMPCGILYDSDCEEWEEGFFSETMQKNLYMRSDGTSEMEHVANCAVYLGSYQNEFYECGIFYCNSHNEAKQVAKMCLRRIDTVKGIRSMDESALSLSSLEGAFVRVSGKLCVYSIMPDNDRASDAFDKVL